MAPALGFQKLLAQVYLESLSLSVPCLSPNILTKNRMLTWDPTLQPQPPASCAPNTGAAFAPEYLKSCPPPLSVGESQGESGVRELHGLWGFHAL